jgi:hypothetical protein
MDMNELLVLWVFLQSMENRQETTLLRPAREPRGKDPIEDYKIVLQLGLLEAAEQKTPIRHNPFVFLARRSPQDQITEESGLQVNFMTFFNFHKPNRRSNVKTPRCGVSK